MSVTTGHIIESLRQSLAAQEAAVETFTMLQVAIASTKDGEGDQPASSPDQMCEMAKLLRHLLASFEQLECRCFDMLEMIGHPPAFGGFVSDAETDPDVVEVMAKRMAGYAELLDLSCSGRDVKAVAKMTPAELQQFHDDNGGKLSSIGPMLEAGMLLVGVCRRLQASYRLEGGVRP